MSDLENRNNIYADLVRNSYTHRKENFPLEELTPSQVNNLRNGNSIPFTFPHAKDAYGNDASKVYLQPDKLKTVTEKDWFGNEKTYQKGLLTDEKAGYNSYYVTDTPKLNSATKHTYFATRGSDGLSLNTLNDWASNNGSFTLFNAHIPQAKLANKAMHTKISELRKKAPNATLAVTGHSLGTMVSIQAVANLPKEINADGTLKEANLNEHGYIFAAGIKVSHLIDKYLDLILKNTGANISSGKLLSLLLGDGALYAKFKQEYQAIVNEAKLASQWQGKVTSLHQRLTTASEGQKIALQEELAQIVATKAREVGEEYMTIFKNAQQELEDEITSIAQEIAQGAYALKKHLSDAEIEEMIAPYTKERLWDSEQATQNLKQIQQ